MKKQTKINVEKDMKSREVRYWGQSKKMYRKALFNSTFEFATGGRVRFMRWRTQIIYLELITVINMVREERKRQRER